MDDTDLSKGKAASTGDPNDKIASWLTGVWLIVVVLGVGVGLVKSMTGWRLVFR